MARVTEQAGGVGAQNFELEPRIRFQFVLLGNAKIHAAFDHRIQHFAPVPHLQRQLYFGVFREQPTSRRVAGYDTGKRTEPDVDQPGIKFVQRS